MPDRLTRKDPARKCALLAEKLHGFFRHLDNQEYIRNFNLKEPSQGYFAALAYRLLDNPPVVSRESDDLYTILKNMAHFFRVIGQDNIILIKTILDRERDKIEDVAQNCISGRPRAPVTRRSSVLRRPWPKCTSMPDFS